MKTSDIEALLGADRVAEIKKRADKRLVTDPFGKAIHAATKAGGGPALAAIKVQQLVGFIPARADDDNLVLERAKEKPLSWAERNPAPAPVVEETVVENAELPADPAPAEAVTETSTQAPA